MEMNRVIRFFFFLLFLNAFSDINAQVVVKYWIGFSDKANSPYSLSQPEAYLSQRSLVRRQKCQVETSVHDFPPNPWYLDSLTNLGLSLHYSSRWLNGAVISSSDSALVFSLLNRTWISEVKDLNKPSGLKRKKGGEQSLEKDESLSLNEDFFRKRRATDTDSPYGKASEQTLQLGVEKLHMRGFLGQGVLVAVFDAGFSYVDTMRAFKHLYLENRVVAAKDFVGLNPYNNSTHGTGVLSTMAASLKGEFLGTAPAASYVLCRTEDGSSEYPVEEYNWVAAAEFADSIGVDLINSSLGYHTFDNPKYDYTYSDMNGHTSIIARAAGLAASKGMLVVTSAGNLGQQAWQYISTPADADSVLAVGAVNSKGQYAPFSSKGPSFDRRIKPDVAAHGWLTWSVTPNGSVAQGNGTSYASPVLAGAAACLMQSVPAATAWQARKAIIESAGRYSHPDSLLGYGIPNFALAHLILSNLQIHNVDKDSDFNVMPNPFTDYFEIAFQSMNEGVFTLHMINSNGRKVMEMENQQRLRGYNYLRINSVENLKKGVYLLRISFDGKLITKKIVKV